MIARLSPGPGHREDAPDRTATLDPRRRLRSGTYVARIRSTVVDPAGNRLRRAVSWRLVIG
jgi:hypothetical protein